MPGTNSYTPHATSGSAITQHGALGHTSRVHVVAASTQFDLTGSDAGNHSFICDGDNANNVFTFADGTTCTGADIAKDTVYEYTLSKVVTHSGTKCVIFWK